MPLQFQNTDEITKYLDVVEMRLKTLEEENRHLRSIVSSKTADSGNIVSNYAVPTLPQTNLVNPNFFKRAFTVWGHFFVANLIIGITIGICYMCLLATVFGASFSNLIQNLHR